jgi:hypothetical protein
MDPWRVCMAVVADFYHFDEKQDPDPEQHQRERSVSDPHQSELSDPNPHQLDADPQH